MTTKQKLFSGPEVKSALAVSVALAAAHANKLAEFAHLTDPDAYRRAHALTINESESAADIEHHAHRLSALEVDGEAFRIASRRARQIVSEAGRELEASLHPLLDAAERAVKSARRDAVKAEEAFFAEHECEYVATAVSQRFAALGLQLIDLRLGLDDGQPRRYGRGCYSNYITWFSTP